MMNTWIGFGALALFLKVTVECNRSNLSFVVEGIVIGLHPLRAVRPSVNIYLNNISS